MTKIFYILAILLLSSACIKTADQVQRERRMESMSEQMKDSQGLVADLVNQNKDLQNDIDKLNGRLEEMEHNQKKVNPDNVSKMQETLTLLQSQQETQGAQLVQIQNELKEQRSFLEKVTASLGSMNQEKPKSAKKKSAKSELAEGLEHVKNNEYSDARSVLEPLLDSGDLTPGDKNKVLHGLGRAEFYSKNYDKALVYFSKMYAKYPKASLAPSSLLFIGRSFQKMGKKDEAKEAYEKLIEDYPASTEAKEAYEKLIEDYPASTEAKDAKKEL